MGMPVDQFTELAYEALSKGDDYISIGVMGMPGTDASKEVTAKHEQLVPLQRAGFERLSAAMRGRDR